MKNQTNGIDVTPTPNPCPYGCNVPQPPTTLNTPVRTNHLANSFAPDFSWNSNIGYPIGASHGHPGGGGPSPQDLNWLFRNLQKPGLANGSEADRQFYKARASITVITKTGSYVATVNDWTILEAIVKSYDNGYYTDASGQSGNRIVDLFSSSATNYFAQNPTAPYVDGLLYAIKAIYGSAINLYRTSASSTNYQPVQIGPGNLIRDQQCP